MPDFTLLPVAQIFFVAVAIVMLSAAVMVVSTRNLVHASLWLIVVLFGAAVIFALLEAGFLVVAQVAVYIGAIAVLIIFAIMLTQRVMRPSAPQVIRQWGLGALVTTGFFIGLWVMMVGPRWNETPAAAVPADSLPRLGLALLDPNQFALPFEVASVMLLAALLGAVVVARDRPKKPADPREPPDPPPPPPGA